MEIVNTTKSFTDLVDSFYEIQEQLCVVIENKFKETIEKMKQTDSIETKKELFEDFLFTYAQEDPSFLISSIDIGKFYREKEIVSYYFNRPHMSFNIHINYQKMTIVEELSSINLLYDNFMWYFFQEEFRREDESGEDEYDEEGKQFKKMMYIVNGFTNEYRA